MLGDIAEEYPQFLSGLAVIDDLGADIALVELEHRVTRLRAGLASDQVILKRLATDGTPEIYWLDFRYLAAQRAFELEWAEQLLTDLSSGRIRFQDTDTTLSLVTKESNERKTS
jgi:hypothetical protein